MKLALVVALMPSAATVADGQSSVRTVMVRADSEAREGHNLHARGHVEIFHGTAVITADEADFVDGGPDGPIDIQLRGNVAVHISVAPR